MSVDDIILTAGETGATKGVLTAKESGVYELAVSGIAENGEVIVAVTKEGYTITPTSRTVMVNYYVAPPVVGNFYYSDNTYSSELKANKTTINIVFWVNPSDYYQRQDCWFDRARSQLERRNK